MKIIRKAVELQKHPNIAFIPTMGALHDGHISLINKAREHSEQIVVSIFVNPTQFAPGEDYNRYPRTEEADAEKLKSAGVDTLYLPEPSDIYPEGFRTEIDITGMSNLWEGEFRPGHFRGVATVVARLLMLVKPKFAIFGEKDFQQLQIIRRMVTDLAIETNIISAPTIRESNGLAMSSRNRYLTKNEFEAASAIYQQLTSAQRSIISGSDVEEVMKNSVTALLQAGFSKVDYFALINSNTLEATGTYIKGTDYRIITAAKIGSARLIDNIAV